MKQITPEIRAKIFGLYLGTMVRWPEHGHFRLRGIDKYSVYIGGRYEPIPLEHFNDVQLILKPLSAISDEDAIEVAKIADKNVIYRIHHKQKEITEYKVWRNDVSVGIERYVGERYMGGEPLATFADGYSLEQIDYLRSKSYALPYLGIDLFESGVAVKHI